MTPSLLKCLLAFGFGLARRRLQQARLTHEEERKALVKKIDDSEEERLAVQAGKNHYSFVLLFFRCSVRAFRSVCLSSPLAATMGACGDF